MNRPAKSAVSTGVLPIILAGGRGSRLYDLTDIQSKPALPIGPSSRLIDFTLANVVHSGINKALILTQYAPGTLRAHLDQQSGVAGPGSDLSIELLDGSTYGSFDGTADAVAKVSAAIDRYKPRHVIILAGDHLYQMDYGPFVESHRASGAQVTVGAIHVPLEEAHGFGVITVDPDGSIIDFVEKPTDPKDAQDRPGFALASMGIYVFEWSLLRDLLRTIAPPHDELDFGKHVLPLLVQAGAARAYTLPARGQAAPLWRDLGTLDAYHRVHADMAAGVLPLDPSWPVLTTTRRTFLPLRSARTETEPDRQQTPWTRCSIGDGAVIGDRCHLTNVVVLPGASIGHDVVLRDAIVSSDAIIPDGFDLDLALNMAGKWCTISETGIHLLSARALAALVKLGGGVLRRRATPSNDDRSDSVAVEIASQLRVGPRR
jgi:glucose-1-phosphate adenylyltransferase